MTVQVTVTVGNYTLSTVAADYDSVVSTMTKLSEVATDAFGKRPSPYVSAEAAESNWTLDGPVPVVHFTQQNEKPVPFTGEVPSWVQKVAGAIPGAKEIVTGRRQDDTGRWWKLNVARKSVDGAWYNGPHDGKKGYINDPVEAERYRASRQAPVVTTPDEEEPF